MTITMAGEGQGVQQEEITAEGALNLVVPKLAMHVTTMGAEKVELIACL